MQRKQKATKGFGGALVVVVNPVSYVFNEDCSSLVHETDDPTPKKYISHRSFVYRPQKDELIEVHGELFPIVAVAHLSSGKVMVIASTTKDLGNLQFTKEVLKVLRNQNFATRASVTEGI